eukprot:TRINITY_DN4892_c0_g1_i1.p1 TRINITY_DN4892_c0_g1~~TRINITY_DN4892_c0_g1_i1.p1  ORF type:complete len:106 (-),score=15.14 TRINITY_DN4892_c0_g1_i1:22-339(-)
MSEKLAILGAGESGIGAALLAQAKGYDVFVSDFGNITEHYKAELEGSDILFEEGKHTEEKILDADLIVKSPGIPDSVAIVKSAKEKGIQVISEIEFAYRHTEAKR